MSKFDAYAQSYEELHRANIAASGEDPSFFHDHKIALLRRKGLLQGPLLDYGCGTGNLTERFVTTVDDVHGYDPSKESLDALRERAPNAITHATEGEIPEGYFRTAVLSGVLHHVKPALRSGVLHRVRRALLPGGHIVVFEHNPLNPVTRRAVDRCPFDDDAILLFPWQAKRVVKRAGFRDVKHDFIVFFPRPLAFLRPLEPYLRGVALGAQQMIVGTR